MSSYKSEQKNELEYDNTLESGKNESQSSGSNPSQHAESVKQLALSIKEYSIMARETLQAVRDSGVIPELAVTVREIATLIRDISAQARQASQELKESGVVSEAASSVKEAVGTVKDVGQDLKEAAKSGHRESTKPKPAGVK